MKISPEARAAMEGVGQAWDAKGFPPAWWFEFPSALAQHGNELLALGLIKHVGNGGRYGLTDTGKRWVMENRKIKPPPVAVVTHPPPDRVAEDVVRLLSVLLDSDGPCGPRNLERQLGWNSHRVTEVVEAARLDSLINVYDAGGDGMQVRITAGGLEAATKDRGVHAASDKATSANRAQMTAPNPKKVFLIFGRNIAACDAVRDFVRSLGLTATDFDHVAQSMGGSPHIHDVILKGMREAQASIVIVTPDEQVSLAPELDRRNAGATRFQARANVIYEAGVAAGFDPERIVILRFGEAALFSDVDGKLRVDFTDTQDSRRILMNRIAACGCTVDAHGDWHRAGDFAKAVRLSESCKASFRDQEVASDAEVHSAPRLVLPGAREAEQTDVPAPGPGLDDAAAPEVLSDPEDALIALTDWLHVLGETPNMMRGTFRFSEIDKKLGLVPGLTEAVLGRAAIGSGWTVKQGKVSFSIEWVGKKTPS